MAEIRVEPKRRSLTWLWVLLALLVLAALAWWFLLGGNAGAGADAAGDTTRTGFIDAPLGVLASALDAAATRGAAA